MRSAVVVHIPNAEPLVGDWRRAHTNDGPAGMPAHVTLLFPFVPRARLAEAEPRLAELVGGRDAFAASFARSARWPALLYLAPEPAAPFVELTNAIAAAWPEHPPYEGEHETVIPHLTVAKSADEALLERIAAELEPRLPVHQPVDAVSLFVEDEARWHEHRRLPLR